MINFNKIMDFSFPMRGIEKVKYKFKTTSGFHEIIWMSVEKLANGSYKRKKSFWYNLHGQYLNT